MNTVPCRQALLDRLNSADASGEWPAYLTQMWRYALERPDESPDEGPGGTGEYCNALPYMPVDPEELGADLGTEAAVLDVGCLGGYGLFDFAERRRARGKPVPRLVGLDIDAASVEAGRDLARLWAGDAPVDFCRGDAARLPFHARSFDVVILRLVLPYVSMRRALAETARVLTASGLAVIQIHSFLYYWSGLARSRRCPADALYYLRALAAGCWFDAVGLQPAIPWLAETALRTGTLKRMCGTVGLEPVCEGGGSRKPIVVFRRPPSPRPR